MPHFCQIPTGDESGSSNPDHRPEVFGANALLAQRAIFAKH
jgi:hypothetical protein